MKNAVFGMDTGFYSTQGAYALADRVRILADLGYDETCLTLWSEPAWLDLPALREATASAGLGISSIYLPIDLSQPLDSAETRRALDAIRQADGVPYVELALLKGDDRSWIAGYQSARRLLDAALAAAEESGVGLSLYPHIGAWLEMTDDAIALSRNYASPALGFTFPVFHWYCVDGQPVRPLLERGREHLRIVNTNGSRKRSVLSAGEAPATIEPIGRGDIDNFAFLSILNAIDYDGSIGVQGYGVGGDPVASFGESIRSIRSIQEGISRSGGIELRADHI